MTVDSAEIILQFDLVPVRDPPNSHRVHADGRYEERSRVALQLGPDGRVQSVAQPEQWRLVTTFTPAQVERLREAIRTAVAGGLKDRYGRGAAVSDGATVTWTLRVDGRQVESVVEGYPGNRVQALDHLYAAFVELREPPPSSSVWRVDMGEAVERTVACDANAVAALRPVLQALYDPNALSPAPASLPLDSSPLLDIRYLTAGVESTRCRLYPEGVYSCTVDGTEQVERGLTSDGLERVRAALIALDLGSKSGSICP